jgi:hypothetical protein
MSEKVAQSIAQSILEAQQAVVDVQTLLYKAMNQLSTVVANVPPGTFLKCQNKKSGLILIVTGKKENGTPALDVDRTQLMLFIGKTLPKVTYRDIVAIRLPAPGSRWVSINRKEVKP